MMRKQQTPPPTVQAEIPRDDEVFADGVAYVRAHAAGPVEGLFGPDSMAWLLFREPFILLGALRAIALQMAHPAVATGVEQHSNFRYDILGRARRTYTTMYHLVFGDLDEAVEAARRLHRLHTRVRGYVEADVQAPAAGQPYRANDPALLLWVQATLVDTAMRLYEHFLRPLTLEEKRRYIKEARLTAALFGVPPEQYPRTLEDFYRYFDAMLESPELTVGRAGRAQVEALLASPYLPPPLRTTLTAGLLPPRFRDAFGLRWDAKAQRRYGRLIALLRTCFRLVPAHLRAVPAYHQATLRLARAHGEQGSLLARTLDRTNQVVALPLSIRPVKQKRLTLST